MSNSPLLFAAAFSKSPAVVEALVNGKANLEVTDEVRHLADTAVIGVPHMCSVTTRVFVEGRLDPSDDRCAPL